MIEMSNFDTRNFESGLSNTEVISRLISMMRDASYPEDTEEAISKCLRTWQIQREGVSERKLYFATPNAALSNAENFTNGEVEESLQCGTPWYELTLRNENNSLCEIIRKQKLYKVVDVEFRRIQTVKVKVVIPEDEDECNAEDYVDDFTNLEDVGTCDTDDWECINYSENDLCSASQIRAIANFDDDWFGEDNLDD